MRLIPSGSATFFYPVLVLFIFFNLLTNSHLYSQSQIDSLKQLLLNGNPDPGMRSLIFAKLAREYCLKNNDSCLIYGETGLRLAEKAGNRDATIKNCVQLGLYLLRNDSLESSKRYFLKANDLFTPETDVLEQMRTLNGLGYISELQSDYAGAISYYLRGKRISEISERDDWRADFINNIAVVYNSAGIYRKSIELYKESMKIYKEQNDSVLYANTLVNIGASYLGLKMTDSARVYYNLSLPIQRRLSNYYGLANLYQGLATIKTETADYAGALDLLETIRTMIDSLNESFHGTPLFIEVGMELNRAIIYQKTLKFREAEVHFRHVRKMAIAGLFLRYETEALRGLSEVFVQLGIKDSALWYANLYYRFADSLLTVRNDQKIALTVEEFNNKIEKERQAAENERRESLRKQNLLVLILAISIIFAIAVVLLLLYLLQRSKSYRLSLMEANLRFEKECLQSEKSSLEKDINMKNKEVMSKAMSLVEKNEQMAEVSNRLKGLMENTGKEDDVTLRSLVRDIQSQYSEGFWEDFNVRFLEIHADFYNRLSMEFPGLTPNEIRLCAFIKLKLTTKEMAQISHKTEHSIKIARYRLRKKLSLARDENLTMFLNKY